MAKGPAHESDALRDATLKKLLSTPPKPTATTPAKKGSKKPAK
jgi:hypothetical protein